MGWARGLVIMLYFSNNYVNYARSDFMVKLGVEFVVEFGVSLCVEFGVSLWLAGVWVEGGTLKG